MPSLSSMLNLSVGDHLCCMYMTEEEHRDILVPFLREGLEQGDKVLYIVDIRTAEMIFGYLEQDGIHCREYLDNGQLVVSESRQTYLREERFDPDSMLTLLEQETAVAVRQGFRALRVTGEMSWALRGVPGSDRLMEYEGKLNRFFPAHRAIGLCQYDIRQFQPQVLLDVLATHPIAVVRNKCYDNMYYVPPEEFLGPNRAQAELDRRLLNLEERRQLDVQRRKFEEELKKSEAQATREAEFTKAIFDTAGALIVVVDREGQIVRFNHTCEQLSGYAAAEVIGRNLWDVLIPEEEVQATRSVFEELSSGRFPNRLQNDWETKDGHRIHVAWSNTCLLDADGNVDLIVSTGLDITDLLLTEKAQNREFRTLHNYSGVRESAMTAASLGIHPLSQSSPERFQALVTELAELLDLAMEQRIYKVAHDVSRRLRQMGETFGRLRAGPRDLVQAYIQALQQKTQGLNQQKARAYTSEGRLVLVELMGFLAAYYFNQCLGKVAGI